jgi:iron complex outermembrane recepter protein
MTSPYCPSRACAAFAMSCLLVISAPAWAADRDFDIPAQPLANALGLWARQAGVQIFFPSKAIRGKRNVPVRGRMSARGALDRLLAGSGLRVALDDRRTVVLASIAIASNPPPRPQAPLRPTEARLAPARMPAPNPDAEAEAPRDIVVTGIRQSLGSAIAAKLRAGAVTDAVGAEDIGKFPDANVVESLQRITGIQITRSRGEGQLATIRGLPPSFTQVEFDGRVLPSAIGDSAAAARSFNFTILPSEFVRSLEVYKSTTADMQEGGLAGTVIVRPPRAFDIGKRSLAIDAQWTWEDNRGEPGQRLSGLFSDVVADGTLGVVLGATYTKRLRETHSVNFLGFRDDAESLAGGLDLDGSGAIEPAGRVEYGNSLYLQIDRERTERTSAFAGFEYRPGADLSLRADLLYSGLANSDQVLVSLVRWLDDKGPTIPGGIVLGPGRRYPRAIAFDSEGVEVRPEGRSGERHGHLLSLALSGEYRAGPWKLAFTASDSGSRQVMRNLGIEASGRFRVGYDTRVDDRLIGVSYGTGRPDILDPHNYQLLTLNGAFNRHVRDRQRDVELELSREWAGGAVRRIDFGLRYSRRALFNDDGRLVLTGDEVNQLLGGTLAPSTVYGGFALDAAPLLEWVTPSRGRFLGSYDGAVVLPGAWIGSNTREFLARFTDAELLAAGDGRNFTNDASGRTDIEERVTAGYAKATIGDADSAVSGNFGVRLVRTDQRARGVSPDFTAITFEPGAGARTTIPAAGLVSIKRSYTDWLPSLNARLALAPDLILRGAATRTMSRPPLADISPTVTASGTRRTIAMGNPYLKPFRANNLDLSLEWYFADRTLLSGALFYKDVLSLVRDKTSSQLLPVTQINADGSRHPLLLDFQVMEPVNGAGVRVKGLELSYQQPFNFLPPPFDGLGAIVNYTYLENSDPAQLTGTSRHSFNLSGYYEDRRLSIRLAYTFRDSFLVSSDGAFGDGERARGFGTLNANLTLRLTPTVSAVIDGTNLLDADQSVASLLGSPLSYEDPGRLLYIGLRARF